MMLTNWVKDHIDELDKDVEDLRKVEGTPADEEIKNEMKTED